MKAAVSGTGAALSSPCRPAKRDGVQAGGFYTRPKETKDTSAARG